jgi:D-aminopeptidase
MEKMAELVGRPVSPEGCSTTIAIVATDAALTKAQAQRLATAAHDGMARAIVPAHTPLDGDLVFAAATGTAPQPTSPQDITNLCDASSLCLARAICRAVFDARPAPGDLLPCWQDTNPD